MPLLDVPGVPQMHPAAAEAWYVLEFGRERLLKEVEGLTEEQLFTVPAGFRNSIATLLCHIAGSDMAFAHNLSNRTMPDELKAEYFLGRNDNLLIEPKGETKESLLAKFDRSRAALKEALLQLTAEDVEKTLERPGGMQITMRWMLALVGYHATLHIGQIQMVKQHLLA